MVQVCDAGLVLVEDQSSGRQPRAQLCLDVFCLVLVVAQGQEIVGVTHHNGAVACRLDEVAVAVGVVADPGRLFHPV